MYCRILRSECCGCPMASPVNGQWPIQRTRAMVADSFSTCRMSPPLTTSTSSLDKDVEFSPNYTPGNVAYTVYTLNFAGLNFRRL